MEEWNKVDKNKLGRELYDTMNDLVSMGFRYPGSDAEKKAAAYILSKLKERGIEAAYEEYEARCFKYTKQTVKVEQAGNCLLYTSPSPRDRQKSRMPSSA